ncbi:MAG: hypothetical protein QOJ25_3243 [Solirubrobacteraceae bacterium]|jgi:hypothetical protein|nr:hypothetical protein [Solirubrobacteraceae bacterium]
MASNEPPPPGAPDDPGSPGDDEPGGGEPGGGEPGGGEPGGGEPGGGEPGGGDADALRRLEERLDRASDAAERLIAEAAAGSSGARRPPPSGWQAPKAEDAGAPRPDLDLLVHLLESLRDLIPPELQQRLVEALRELLLAVRALINWYLERLDSHREEPKEVQDIPIDWD